MVKNQANFLELIKVVFKKLNFFFFLNLAKNSTIVDVDLQINVNFNKI